jgi:N-dimethylarginine dimethylaminohydrolase
MSLDLSEVGQLTRVVLKHARDAFVDQGTIDAHWRELRFAAAPDFARANDESDRFLTIVQSSGAQVDLLPRDPRGTLDSIYVRDASIVCSRGVILCRMGKPQRAGEPKAQESAFATLPSTPVIGRIREPGRLEGGDVIWLDPRTIVVGRGYRTNDEGIRQLRSLLDDEVEMLVVPLPHWRGTADVIHLMSLVSPVDRDLAVVYAPLLPVPFRELLLERGLELVEVPDEEFETMGTNVLALAPRRCLMLSGNRATRTALERAGADVLEYEGHEISVKGAGGPTCLTRPLERQA